MSIPGKINSLITAANTKTGESDTTLTDAVQRLCDGYGGGFEPEVPVEYTQLEYIESSGTQCIDTGVQQSIETRIVASICSTKPSQGDYRYVFGGKSGNAQFNVSTRDTYNSYWFNATGATETRLGVPAIFPITIDEKKNLIKITSIGDVFSDTIYPPLSSFSVSSAFNASGGDDWGNTYLFTRPRADGTMPTSFTGRMYRFKQYDGDTLLCDLVPAIRNSDEVIGMYDIVRNVFLTNIGTGEFIGGEI